MLGTAVDALGVEAAGAAEVAAADMVGLRGAPVVAVLVGVSCAGVSFTGAGCDCRCDCLGPAVATVEAVGTGVAVRTGATPGTTLVGALSGVVDGVG